MSEPPNIDLELTGLQRATLSSLLKGEEAIQPPEWLSVEAAIDDESERARAAADPEAFWAPSRPAASEPPQDPLGQDRPPRYLKAQAMGEDPGDLSTLAD
jgi:hypothetical protein